MPLNLDQENYRLAQLSASTNEGVSLDLIQGNFHSAGFIPPRKPVMDAMHDYLEERMYKADSLGSLSARLAIAKFYKKGGPISPACLAEIEPANILITASCSESYQLLFNVLTKSGDNVLLPQPGYPLFDDLAAYAGLETRYYPLQAAKNWQIDCDVLEVLIDKNSKFLVLISPNNPSGSIISEATIKRLLSICKREKIMLICDEVFSEFLYGASAECFPRPASFSEGVPIFTLNGISKLFASPDLKLAWIALSYGPDQEAADGFPDAEEIMAALELYNDTFLSANSFTQFALPRFFVEYTDFVRSMVKKIESNRNALLSIRPGQKAGWTFNPPEGGIHVILSLKTKLSKHGVSKKGQVPEDEKLAIFLLQKHSISLHPAWYYGYFSDNDDEAREQHLSLVISLLAEPSTYPNMLKKLDAALLDYSKSSESS